MFQASLCCYPWDLVHEGIDDVLDRIKGEAGVGGIVLPMLCPPVRQFRPHAVAGAPRTFRTNGGAQFQPDSGCYAATRVRPVVSGWIRKTNPMAAVAEACRTRGLTLRAAVNCCHSPVVIDRHPAAAVKDMFGEASLNWMCPVNPDVREYLRALVADLAGNYPLEAIELADAWFMSPDSVEEGERPGVDLAPLGRWLRSLCFCESCRQAGESDGIDVAAAARSANVRLENILRSDEPPGQGPSEVMVEDPLLARYVAWRSCQLTSLIGILHSAAAERCRLVVQQPADPAGRLDTATVAGCCDALQVAPGVSDVPHAQQSVQELLGNGVSPRQIEIMLRVTASACPDAASLVRGVSAAARLGVRCATLSNYGLIPLHRLSWIRQAIRYAQRECA